jgi:EpsI family protein
VTNSLPRFLSVLLLFASAAGYLRAHGSSEVFPAHQPVESFPTPLGPWNGTDLDIDQEIRDVLGPGEFLSRVYSRNADQGPSNELFIAYFPSQRTGDTIHSPMHCLPGSGWLPMERSQVTLSLGGHAPFPANRVVIAKGELRQVVLYWYWAHDRGVASEYWAKYYLIKDSIQLHRSDGALVRIITPVYPGEDANAAYRRILPFAGEIVPRLDDYIPR